MKIAIVTGASSGMGKEFARQIPKLYQCLDEIWVVSRSKEKLARLQKEIHGKVVPVSADLKKRSGRKKLAEKLLRENPRVKILVNGAGIGKIGNFSDLPGEEQNAIVRLNCEALTAVTHLALPFMHPGSRILMMASAAAFVPQPGFAVYAASKSYVLSFSRALGSELKKKGITVTAVCPGPVDTPFFETAEQLFQMPAFKKSSMARPEAVVKQAVRDGAAGKDLSIYGRRMTVLAAACKVLPHRLLIWGMQHLKTHEETERTR